MKKIILVVLLFLLLLPNVKSVYAQESTVDDVVDELINGIEDSNIEEIYKSSGFDFKQVLKGVIDGELEFGVTEIINCVTMGLVDDLKDEISCLSGIIAVIVLCSLISALKLNRSENIDEIVFYVCFCIIVGVLSTETVTIISDCNEVISLMDKFSQAIMPICVTLLTVCGKVSTANICTPTAITYNSLIVDTVNKVILPAASGILVLSIISTVSKTVKLNKLKEFLSDSVKWIIGIIFCIFSVLITVQGLVSGLYDNVYIKLGKYTVSSGIPVVGGYLGASMDVIIASASIVKSALGLSGVVLIIITVIKPIIEILIFCFALKLISALCESFCDERITGILGGVSNGLGYFVASLSLCGLCFIVFLTVIAVFGGAIV